MPPATPSALPALSVSSPHVRAVLLGAQRHGFDPAPLLARAGLPAELPGRVPARRFGRLVGTLWRRLDDELIGFGEAPSRFGTFATMADLVVRGSRDLREALPRGHGFYGLFPAGPRFRLVEPASPKGEFEGSSGVSARASSRANLRTRRGSSFDVSGYDDPVRFGAETTVVVPQRFAGWLIGRRLGLRRVEFGYPEPRHAPEYALLFGAPRVFGAPRTAVVFDRGRPRRAGLPGCGGPARAAPPDHHRRPGLPRRPRHPHRHHPGTAPDPRRPPGRARALARGDRVPPGRQPADPAPPAGRRGHLVPAASRPGARRPRHRRAHPRGPLRRGPLPAPRLLRTAPFTGRSAAGRGRRRGRTSGGGSRVPRAARSRWSA